ncbi:hypothetical protein BDW75DRAFT_123488 [Aspergillus navahoensis]
MALSSSCTAANTNHSPKTIWRMKSFLQSRRRANKGVNGKKTLYLSCISSFVVLILNLSVICWASVRDRSSLFLGDCDRMKRISVGIHLLINIFSTTLLSASNYGMQCLSAPTRQDVDRSHAKKQWLDIGVSSLRNLLQVSWTRVLPWLGLLLSSLPLHLLWPVNPVFGAFPFSIREAWSKVY